MNVGEKMKEAVAHLESNWGHLCDVEYGPSIKEDWNKDYAYIAVALIMEEYRDYEVIVEDLYRELLRIFPKAVLVRHGRKGTAIKGYEMAIHNLAGCMNFELEVYSVKAMAKLRKDNPGALATTRKKK